jgi:flagellar motility protein MotE (MotC chaperone)
MKKLFTVLSLTLALNFLAVAGGVGYLYGTKKLDKDKIHAIKEIVFPPPAPEVAATQPTTQPAEPGPMMKLEEMLAAHAGLPAAEQVQMLQRTFDFRMTQLDEREKQVNALQDLVKNAESRLIAERKDFDQKRTALDSRAEDEARLASDKGFQESLQLYGTMQPKQVKNVFANLPDDVVVRYLRAMEPRKQGKILSEFKTPAELQRVKALMEQVRSAEPVAPAEQ